MRNTLSQKKSHLSFQNFCEKAKNCVKIPSSWLFYKKRPPFLSEVLARVTWVRTSVRFSYDKMSRRYHVTYHVTLYHPITERRSLQFVSRGCLHMVCFDQIRHLCLKPSHFVRLVEGSAVGCQRHVLVMSCLFQSECPGK